MELEISSPKTTVSTGSGEFSTSSGNHPTPSEPPTKKKRNLPGMPDPNAIVIALSPKTLMATNRFVCEICNKGFQRDQNLQLHRRGHNLPWKLKQRTGTEIRKKVYLCPEPSCVHHDPARALGDLTGIKKHFCRKHGEKKWKCERCSKKYAVQADWKAHMKTCGSREYKCDCGTLFSRRDSFITHRAFCDALAEESSKAKKMATTATTAKNPKLKMMAAAAAASASASPSPSPSSPPPPPPLTPSATVISPVLSIHSPELPENNNQTAVTQQTYAAATTSTTTAAVATTATTTTPRIGQSTSSFSNVSSSTNVFASIFAPSTTTTSTSAPSSSSTSFSHLISSSSEEPTQTLLPSSSTTEPTSLRLSSPSLYHLSSNGFSLFPTPEPDHRHFALSQPAMSATALLQKAAQMGATASNASLLRGLGLSMSSPGIEQECTNTQWSSSHVIVKPENNSAIAAGLGLGLHSGGGNLGLTDLMMGPSSSLYGTKPATLDLLGLGIGIGPQNDSTGGLSALLNSFGGGGLDEVGGGENSTARGWDGQPEREPNGPALF